MEQIANWVAPIATTIAALMTASNLGTRVTGYGFVVFTVGSLAWTALGIATGQSNLVWQNIILTALNLFGIWRWLGRQSQVEEGGKEAQMASAAAPTPTLFPASFLTKAPIVGHDKAPVAHCIDAMLDTVSGRPAYVVASVGGVAGVGEKLLRLPWGILEIAQDAVRLDSLDGDLSARFEEIPRDQWPGR
jgi:hypothetical protein